MRKGVIALTFLLILSSCIYENCGKISNKNSSKNLLNNQEDKEFVKNYIMFNILSEEEFITAVLNKTDFGIYINIERNYYTEDFQDGLKVAIDFCRKFTGEEFGVIFDVNASGYILKGRSSSAMIAVACIAMINNYRLKNDTIVIGAISSDGYLLPIYNLDKKLKIAKRHGIKEVIIPYDNSPRNFKGIKIVKVINVVDSLKYILDYH